MAGGKGKLKGAKDGVPFKKNDPRINKAGRPRKLPDLDRHLIQCLGEKVNDTVALKLILIALRKSAMAGDVRAIELLLDRAYGKLKQPTEHSGSITVPITGINYIVPNGAEHKPDE